MRCVMKTCYRARNSSQSRCSAQEELKYNNLNARAEGGHFESKEKKVGWRSRRFAQRSSSAGEEKSKEESPDRRLISVRA
ncbi:hypothetical protein OJAV_G00025710 [Oryzias javanicus]|uniref:Uncharacterized protein n=1 Tax=Oryzias javanicus TaxID=123683 RepID=A0A437DJG7_ORYJA|nr:hypothetical protein OJAV_G00025710 [Oryzias javanicus]